jgi:hypothetical protein
MGEMRPGDRRRVIATIWTGLGLAALLGGASLAAHILSDDPSSVKPATGSAQAMSLAGSNPRPN